MTILKMKRDVAFDVKSVDDSGTFEGYGSVFGVKDSYSDIILPGAFTESLEAWKAKGRMPALLWMHMVSEPIGVYEKMVEDDHGLFVKGRLLIDEDPLAARAHAHMKAGSLTGLSIGYNLSDNDYYYDDEKRAFMIEKVDLWEVSPVTFPANDEARISGVKMAIAKGIPPEPKTVEGLLRDAGLSRRQAKAFMSRGYNGLIQRDVDETVEAIEAAKAVIAKLKSLNEENHHA